MEHLKRRRQGEEREQYKWLVLTRPGTLYPPPTRTPCATNFPSAECGMRSDTTAETGVTWQTAPPRMPIPPATGPTAFASLLVFPLQCEPIPVGWVHKLVRLGAIGKLHVRSVPFELLVHADRDIAQQHHFGQVCGVIREV